MVWSPAGVEAEVEIVSVLVQVGLQEVGLKEAVASEGRPEAASETDWVAPAESVAVIVFDPDEPRVTVILPELESE